MFISLLLLIIVNSTCNIITNVQDRLINISSWILYLLHGLCNRKEWKYFTHSFYCLINRYWGDSWSLSAKSYRKWRKSEPSGPPWSLIVSSSLSPLLTMIVELSSTNRTVLASTLNELHDAKPMKCMCAGEFACLLHVFFADGTFFVLVIPVLHNWIARVNVSQLHPKLS